MVRDDDFIRELLLKTEASVRPYIVLSQALNAKPEEVKKIMHAKLLCDAGLFAEENSGVFRLTNAGHDYLAAIRSDTIWNKTKESAASAGGVTLGLMKDMAIAYLKKELAEKTGLSL